MLKRIKNLFNPIDYELFPKILSVGAIIRNEKEEVLLKIRTKEPDLGKWEIIAGYVEPEETLFDAVKRVASTKVQIKELENIEFTGKYYDKVGRHKNTNCIPLIFTANIPKNKIKETNTLKWFSKKVLLSLDYALDNKEIIEDYLKYSKSKKEKQITNSKK